MSSVRCMTGENARSADEAHKVKGSNGFLSSKTTTRDSTRHPLPGFAHRGATGGGPGRP